MLQEDGSRIGIHSEGQPPSQEACNLSEYAQFHTPKNHLIDTLAEKQEALSVPALAEVASMSPEKVTDLLAMSNLSQQVVVIPNDSGLLYRLKRREDLVSRAERIKANSNTTQIADLVRDHPHATVDLLQQETKLQRYQIWDSLHGLTEKGWTVHHPDTRSWTYRDWWSESIEPQLEAHCAKLYKYVFDRVYDRDYADDIVQSVYIEAYSCRYSLNPRSNLLPWFLQVEHHRMFDKMRRKSAIPFSQLRHSSFNNKDIVYYDEPFIETIPDENSSPEEVAEHRAAVAAIMESLPQHLRQVVLLRYHHGLKLAEVGKEINKTQRTAQTYLTQAQALMEQARLEFGDELLS